jgi:hypothetical protein
MDRCVGGFTSEKDADAPRREHLPENESSTLALSGLRSVELCGITWSVRSRAAPGTIRGSPASRVDAVQRVDDTLRA